LFPGLLEAAPTMKAGTGTGYLPRFIVSPTTAVKFSKRGPYSRQYASRTSQRGTRAEYLYQQLAPGRRRLAPCCVHCAPKRTLHAANDPLRTVDFLGSGHQKQEDRTFETPSVDVPISACRIAMPD